MKDIINTIINLIKGKNYTVLVLLVILLLFIWLYKILKETIIKSIKSENKHKKEYMDLLIRLCKSESKSNDCKCYYDLLAYVDDNRQYRRIEYYLEKNDNNSLNKFVRAQIYELRQNSIINSDGLDFLPHSYKYLFCRSRICNTVILPAVLSFFIIFMVLVLLYGVASNNDLEFVLIIITYAIPIILTICSFSIMSTKRYSFDPLIKKVFYSIPFFVLVIEMFLKSSLVLYSIISFVLYIIYLIVLNNNRRNKTVNITKFIDKFKKKELDIDKELGIQCKNDINIIISKEENVYSFAYFDIYSLVAVYQYKIIDGKVTSFNSFEDVSILNHKEKINSEVNKSVKKILKTNTIYPISSNDN